MASKKKQKDMGLHEEGVATPAADHPAVCFVVLKPGKASEGQMEQSTRVTNEGPDMVGKHNMSMEAISTSGGLPAMKHPASSNPQADNLSSDSICKGIRVTLDNNSMWNEFFRCKTEMILTKQGSRMFPYCRFRISGLQPSKKYFLIMDIQPLDNCRYKWTGKGWQVAGKAECHVKSQPFEHPESPSTGQHWMQNPVSFYKLKLTNNISDQEANTILHAMHRYLPRLHVVQTDKAAKDIKLDGPNVVTFTFPQTEFMAVTAYQNSRFAQLKVGYNPFAKGLKEDGFSSWGLKLKINSGREASRNGGKITNEQHPVKKSLKVLLANHKPRSSKSVDSKTSAAGDDQKNATINEDKSCPKIPRESSCSSHPVRKLFSELTREAHVSLQRYNLEQLGINNHTSYRAERTNTKATALKTSRQDTSRKDSISVKMHSDVSLGKNDETIVTNRKVKEDKHLLNSLNCKDSVRADCSDDSAAVAVPVLCQDSSVDSDQRGEPEPSSEMSVKQQKRPAPLPLPALALFLKQHSTKSKKAKSKLDCPPSVVPSESLSGSQCSSACPPSDHSRNVTHPLKDLTKSDNLATEAALQPFTTDPNRSRTESSAVAENPVTDPTVTYDTSVLPNSDHQFCTPGTSTSTLATSSASCILPPPLEIMLPLLKSPQTPNITESSTQPSDFPTMKTDSLLADPECSSFGFEPLSPASSPEPLPPLPASLALELESTTSEPTFKAIPPEEMHQSEDSAASVFKWHTVLREPYIDTSFVTFQPTPQDLPLVSVTPPLLRSQSTSHPEPQTLDPCKPTPDSASSLQENEQSLPFPVEFSPFALQLPLSPTFSSLDGEGLSPTPSIADLVHFFSTNDDLGMEVEFSNTEGVVVPCSPPSTLESNAHEPSQHVQLIQANKVCKRNKKSQRRKLARMGVAQKMDSSTYTRMQPNLEEVEEQLFISFTSKEALKLHIVDSQVAVPHPEATPEGHLQQPADAPENAETAESQQDRISASEKILLKNLKLMKHRQIIHPVLQEVGLKMNLLDSTLAIDLQYLGVCLPIPPPGVSVELPLSQGVSAAFVSRTGKTTDVTQIKGWREKFTPPEAPSTPSLAKPEAGPSSDLPKKNLSAFCSDMLDEYLESEGKLIDERAASFSQPVVEPVLYELPTRSTSYVRTLDSVLKKEAITFPTSDLISGFVPPSKRPKLSLRKKKTSNKGEEKTQKGPKQNKPRPECAPPPVPTLERNLVPKQAAVHTPAATPPSVHTAPVTEPPKSKKKHLKIQFAHTEPLTLSPQTPALKKKKKLKPKTSSQTLSPSRSTAPPPGISRDMAPLESDSELGTADQGDETCRKGSGLVMTRALLKQKDLEDGVVWEGRPRTSITEERATIALTSLFTLMPPQYLSQSRCCNRLDPPQGFVSENPTAPIRLMQRRAPPCLNDFCRLGCICSSLLHCSRISHCGRLRCIFGCSCLKQKVVLLKNLDGSDSSSSHQENNKKSRRKRRMKMAYILKEVDSVTQPTEQVRTLWKRDGRDSDPDPVYVPEPASLLRSSMSRENNSSCARVRGYSGMRKTQKQKEAAKHVKPKAVRLKSLKQRDLTLMEATTRPSSPPPVDEPIQPTPISQPPSPPPEIPTKPSKRLIILAECKWESDANRNHILMKLCEAMAQNQLDNPFWIGKYLITPISHTVDENGTGHCIQYKIYISTPKVGWEKPALPQKPQQERQIDMNPHRQETDTKQQQDHLRQMIKHQEPLEDRQQEGTEEEEPLEDQQQEGMEKEERLEDRQREGMEKEECLEDRQREGMQEEESLEDRQREGMEEEEPLDDWQQEVQEGDTEEKKNSTVHQEDDGKEGRREKMETKAKNKKQVSMALPLLTGVSPAGFLSANKKQPRGTDHVVQVNGKLYPLAKVQLGSMGALHPANRLAAYLTGRVGSSRKQQGTLCSSSSSSKPPQTQSSGLTLQTVSSASPGLATSTMTPCPSKPQSSATELMLKASSTVLQPAVKKVNQSAVGSSSQPTGETPEVEGTQFINLRVYPSPVRPGSQFRTVRAASAPKTDFEASSSMVQPGNSCPGSVAPKGSHMLLVPVQGPGATAPVSGLAPQVPGPPTTSQRTVLQSVQTASGVKYYRRQDGKLVQLVPVSQLQSANPHMPVERGPSFENSSSPSSRADRGGSVRSAAPPQTPVVTVVSQTLPLTTVTMTTSTPSLSGLRSFTVSPPTTPLCPDPGFLAQKGMCTIRIIPVKPSKEPVFIACPKLLPKSPTKILSSPGSFTPLQPQPCPPATPVNLISLRPSTGQRAKVGVKMLTVSPVPVGPGGVAVQQKPASSQVSTCTTQTPTETTHRPTTQALLPPPPSVSEVTPGPPADRGSPEPELACNLVDLDIVCVEDEAELITTVAQPMEVVDLGSSSETDNSSDFEDEPMTMSHNEQERERRRRLQQLFNHLRTELGLTHEKTSKVFTLNKAMQVIKKLKTTQRRLRKTRRKLRRRRDDYLSIIAPTAGESRRVVGRGLRVRTACKRADTDVMEVVDLLDNSSDENNVITKETSIITVTSEEEEVVPSVTMEMEVEDCLLAGLARVKSSESSLCVKQMIGGQSVTVAESAGNSPERLLLEQALQSDIERITCLDPVTDTSGEEPGKCEQSDLRKVQHLSSQQEMEKQEREASRMPAAPGGGVFEPPAGSLTDSDVIIASSDLQQSPQAPPIFTSATPTVSLIQQALGVLEGSNPVQDPPAVSHSAPVLRDKPRTIPNILSRSKNPAPLKSVLPKTVQGETLSFQALVPAEVLPLVGAALPGKPILTLSPLLAGPTVLQTTPTSGVASVTLNIPSLASQQVHLTSLPHTITATDLNNLLHLVQPVTTQLSPQEVQQQSQAPQLQQIQPQLKTAQQQVPAGQSLPPPPTLVSAGSDQSKDQDQPSSQSDLRPDSSQAEVELGGAACLERQETRRHGETERLTSLLNEILVLNQQTITTVMTAGALIPEKQSPELGEAQEQDHACGPWLLQLDSDSDDAISVEMEEVGLNEGTETTETGTPIGLANGNTIGAVLAPPPLLQMKMGGAKVVDPISSDGAEGGGRGDGGVAWRPMPRLVPLGLRGNPPS